MIRRLLASALLAVFLTGCATSQPINNITETPVPRLVTASQDQVGKAIISAVNARGWRVIKDEPRLIEASINVRSHRADVSIPYSEKGYSIEYKNSVNLDHSDDMIHRNYNKWVTLLDRQIQQELLDIK